MLGILYCEAKLEFPERSGGGGGGGLKGGMWIFFWLGVGGGGVVFLPTFLVNMHET